MLVKISSNSKLIKESDLLSSQANNNSSPYTKIIFSSSSSNLATNLMSGQLLKISNKLISSRIAGLSRTIICSLVLDTTITKYVLLHLSVKHLALILKQALDLLLELLQTSLAIRLLGLDNNLHLLADHQQALGQ
jgi:hypothetical protein